MDAISVVGRAPSTGRLSDLASRVQAIGASKDVTTRPDGSVVTTIVDTAGRLLSRGVESAQVSTVTTPYGAVLDRIMSPRGGVMYVRMVEPPDPRDPRGASGSAAPPTVSGRVPARYLDVLA